MWPLFSLWPGDLEDQILFAKPLVLDLQGARNAAQFGNVFFFQFSDGLSLQAGCL